MYSTLLSPKGYTRERLHMADVGLYEHVFYYIVWYAQC